MPKFIDRSNTFVENTLILKRYDSPNKQVEWVCKCQCGNIFHTRHEHLKRNPNCPKCGRSSQAEKIKKHGKYNSNIYSVWIAMKQRCFNPNTKSYKDYGGRGITVCDEWKNDFLNFYNWALNNGYKKGLSIDRTNVNGNYEPQNCRWATTYEQSINRRNNNYIYFNGETLPVTEMAKKYGFEPQLIRGRLSKKWTVERALTTPMDLSKSHKKTILVPK